jgi:hypothetical protein
VQQLAIRYPSRIRPNRSYKVEVELVGTSAAEAAPSAEPIVVRLAAPGAYVVPPDLALDRTQPSVRGTFRLVPLTHGPYADSAVEVFYQDAHLQSVPLLLKAARTGAVKALLTLAVLVPLLFVVVGGNPRWWSGEDEATKPTAAGVAATLPGWVPGRSLIADGAQRGVDAIAAAETKNHLAFHTFLALAALTVIVGLAQRGRRRVVLSAPLAHGGAVLGTTRVPSYLTPVPAAELGRMAAGD